MDWLIDVLVRAVCMYIGFYFAIFLGGPVLAIIHAWTGMSLWSWWLLFLGGSIAGDLILLWPDDRLEPVELQGRTLGPWQSGKASMGGRVRVGKRPQRVGFVPSGRLAPHRQVRFGHTRLR